MDEDLVALLAIPVVAWAAYAGLPLLDPPAVRARSARPPQQPQPPGHRPRIQSQSQQPQPQPQNQNPRVQAESFAQKAAQRRATRIGR